MTIDLLVVASDLVALTGLRAIVDRDERIRVVGAGIDGASPADRARNVPPRVAILSDPPGAAALGQSIADIRGMYRPHPPRIIVISRDDSDGMLLSAVRAGVSGYFSQVGCAEDVLGAVRIVAGGGSVFGPTVADKLVAFLACCSPSPSVAAGQGLTEREAEILELLALGMKNRQIARRLHLAEKTVRTYVSRVLAKLDVDDRAAAAAMARATGMSHLHQDAAG